MKRILSAFIVAAIAFLVLGCSESEPVQPQPQPVQTAPAPPVQGEVSGEQAYLNAIRTNIGYVATDESLVSLGYTICEFIGSNPTDQGLETVVQIGIDSGLPPGDVGFIVGAAIGGLCPQYEYVVQNYI